MNHDHFNEQKLFSILFVLFELLNYQIKGIPNYNF